MAKKKQKKKNPLPLIAGCAAVLLVLLAALLLMPKAAGNTNAPGEKLPKGITVGGVDVGGMTRAQAEAEIRKHVNTACESQDLILSLPNKKHTLSPAETGARWDISGALDQAAAAEKNTAIPLEFTMDSAAVRSRIDAIWEALGGAYRPSGYTLTGTPPDFSAGIYTAETLTLDRGRAGVALDADDLHQKIEEACKDGSMLVKVPDIGSVLEPEKLDPDAIWETLYIAPQEPSLDRETGIVTPGVKGYGFNLEDAKTLLAESRPGDTVTVPMEVLDPMVSDADVYFQDILGSVKTPHTDNENRNENLRLACEKLNGLILQPGEILSYNELLGPRTREKGYLPAPAYSGTELVDEIGGGICQVSSSLYLSALFAELHIVERKNHGYPADYIPIGLDATVNWGTTDLKIQNNYENPVKILAEVTGGNVVVRIMGIETRDYTVKIEHRVEGPRYASAYLYHYDKVTGEVLSKVLDHASLYLDVVWQNPGFAENDSIITYRTVKQPQA